MAERKAERYSDVDMRFTIETDGDVLVHKGKEVLRQSIKMILATTPGERVMNPLFGSSLKYYLFEPMTEDIAEDMEDAITDDITRFEPRVEVINVSVNGFFKENRYEITVHYRMDTGEEDTFVGRLRSLNVE